jgi:hypothetical protein
VSLRQDSFANSLIDAPRGGRGEQRAGVVISEPPYLDLRKVLERMPPHWVPHRKDQEDSLRHDAACNERQGLGRDLVEPMSVIDQTDKRTLLRDDREQGQDGQADQEAIRGATR